MNRKTIKALALLWGAILIILLTVWLTLSMTARSDAPMHIVSQSEFDTIERYRRLEQVRSALMDEYYVPLDEETLLTGAIRGMMAAPDDPYTFYYTPEEMQKSNEASNGVYHGVGMLVQLTDDGGIEVVQVYPDTPAERAGILAGDRIIAVDGEPASGENQQTFNEAVQRIQGEDGTEVVIRVERNGESIDLTARRGEVSISHVSYGMLENDIGYVALTQFTGDDADGFIQALNAFKEAQARGIVVDLRNNPGGLLDHVVKICDQVLPEGLITYVEDRHGNRQEEKSSGDYWNIPMVVLVNGNSASASELFTAAFQDYERGQVVGTTTYGKGIVQSLITFQEDGAGMQLTTASYFSPKGRSIHLTGVEPDIVVELNEDAVIDIDHPDPTQDNQLAEALKALEREINPQ